MKGATIHWVNAADALDAEIRLYDNLFTVPNPDEGNFLDYLNPDSLKVLTGCKVEKCLGGAKPGESYQFLRQGYFCVDNKDTRPVPGIQPLRQAEGQLQASVTLDPSRGARL